MNKLSTIHLHTRYSDGDHDAYEYIEKAIQNGLSSIGVSDHSPVPLKNNWCMKPEDLPRYVAELEYLKKNYAKHIKIYSGIELDYIQGHDVKKYIDFDNLNLDYFIGAVHFIYSDTTDAWSTVDNTSEAVSGFLQDGFSGNGEKFFIRYYETVREMIAAYNPMVIAHIDVLQKRNIDNSLFDDKSERYLFEVEKTLNCISDNTVEVNTGAWSKDIDVLYPDIEILKMCEKKGIGIMLNSDSHNKDTITYGYDRALKVIKKAGFSHVYRYEGCVIKTKI